jgi:hypothetical protein
MPMLPPPLPLPRLRPTVSRLLPRFIVESDLWTRFDALSAAPPPPLPSCRRGHAAAAASRLPRAAAPTQQMPHQRVALAWGPMSAAITARSCRRSAAPPPVQHTHSPRPTCASRLRAALPGGGGRRLPGAGGPLAGGPEARPATYNSAVDDLLNPEIFVVEDKQAYPAYLITYQPRG